MPSISPPQPLGEETKKSFNTEVATLRLSLVIELEREMRNATSVEALRFTFVNRLRELIPYHQAVLLRQVVGKHYTVDSISNIAVIQRDAPFIAWIQGVAAEVYRGGKEKEIHTIDNTQWPKHLRDQNQELSSTELLWCPLLDANSRIIGSAILARSNPWRESELVLLNPILDCMSHAWNAYLRKRRLPEFFRRKRLMLLICLGIVSAAMFLPVSHSSLAPSEVVAYKPDIVSAPLEGVVKEILVEPNAVVEPEHLLLEYDDTIFRNAYEVALREVDLARVELARVTQGSFGDAKSKAEQAIMAARLEKKNAELQFAKEQYNKVNVKAAKSGVVIYNSPDDWIGRPVAIGERIMLIADPQQVAVDAFLSVKDSLELRPGSRVQIFLDNSPLEPLEGELLRSSYEPEQTPDGVMAFRVKVLLNPGERIPRIGASGVSKIYGDPVSLFFFLFRRPLTVLRQTLGF